MLALMRKRSSSKSLSSKSVDIMMEEIKITRQFPMKVMKISDFTKCGCIMKLEEAEAAGLLHDCVNGMLVIFVSHTWLQRLLPDNPDHIKYRTLCEVFQLATIDDITISPYWLAELFQTATPIKLESVASAYIWMDYLSVPQEGPVRQAKAIESIVSYVEAASYFIVLAPVAKHWTDRPHDLSLWKSRGWCRLERLANALSEQPKQTVVINSPSSVYVSFSHDWLFEPVGSGDFTVDADREPLGRVLHVLIQRAQYVSLQKGDVRRYRQLDCMMLSLLQGLPVHDELKSNIFSKGIGEWMWRMGFKSATDGEASGWSPLRYAMYQGRLDIAQELIARGADINAPLAEVDGTFGYHMPGCTILHGLAYARNSPEGISLLVARRANPMGRQSAGLTPIMLAAHGQRLDNFKLFAEIAPDLLACPCDFACRPLDYAVSTGSSQLFTLAHDLTCRIVGFDPTWHDGRGVGVVSLAIVHLFDPKTLQVAIDTGYDVNWAGTDEHMTPDSVQLIATLAQAGESTEMPTELQQLWGMLNGSTALMVAAHFGRVTAMRMLLDAGASLDMCNAHGRTALIFACMAGHAKAAKMLLDASAAGGVVDNRGRTAADWALARNHNDVADLVLRWFPLVPIVSL